MLCWRLWIRFIGILSFLQSLDYPYSIPLCILDFRLCLGIGWAPYVDKFEEGCRCLECICRLPTEVRTYPNGKSQILLRDLVCLHGSVRSLKCLQSKLLHICLASCIIDYRIIRGIVCFDLDLLNICQGIIKLDNVPVPAYPSRSSYIVVSRRRHCASPSRVSD